MPIRDPGWKKTRIRTPYWSGRHQLTKEDYVDAVENKLLLSRVV
jgi:hypothetical protein